MKKRTLFSTLSGIAICVATGLWPSKVNAQIITTVAGTGTTWVAPGCGLGDGSPATSLVFAIEVPSVAVDATGNILVCDFWCSTIRKINSSGTLITLIGATGIGGGMGDGGPATAGNVYHPEYVTTDAGGNIYFTHGGNFLRKINSSGILSTIAGNGSTPGPVNDGGMATATYLGGVTGFTFDAAGNLYLGDNTYSRVRKVTPAGVISTFAGSGAPGSTSGYLGDGGQATAAKLGLPKSVAIDGAGNLFIADMYNHAIRKVNTAGIITTIAGNGTAGFAGDGGPASAARLNYPADIKFDHFGNLFIADRGNERIRVINTYGKIFTVAGTGIAGFSGDGGAATAAKISAPMGIALDLTGNLYIADDSNSTVRKVTPIPSLATVQLKTGSSVISIFPNPNKGEFTISGLPATSTDELVNIEIADIVGHVVYRNNARTQSGKLNAPIQLNELPDGLYFLRASIPGNEPIPVQKFQIQR